MSLKKVIQSREHRERSQPASRQKLGLLEKKKDYVLRARDFHKKERRLKALRQRAAQKNPDEFYFGMINSKVTSKKSTGTQLPGDVLKLLKSQDLQYVSMQKHLNAKKMDRLQADLPQSLAGPEASAEHLVFVEDPSELDEIIHSQPQNANDDISNEEEIEGVSKKSAALREYQIREERIRMLTVAERKLQTQKHLMQPGRRKIVGTDEFDQPIFKWRAERKR